MTAEEVIQRLGLIPLPGEGGFFRENYRSDDSLSKDLPSRYGANAVRVAGTAIYYFLTPETFSALHRLKSDEIYHFYRGDRVQLTTVDREGRLEQVTLGGHFELGEQCQHVVRSGVWQGSRLMPGGQWALLGTTVAPGFVFEDCELANPDILSTYSTHAEILRTLLA